MLQRKYSVVTIQPAVQITLRQTAREDTTVLSAETARSETPRDETEAAPAVPEEEELTAAAEFASRNLCILIRSRSGRK